MSTKRVTLLVLILIILSFGGFLVYKKFFSRQKVVTLDQAVQQTNTTQKWEPQTYEQSGISVTVTPVDLSSESKEWKFNVSVDTNSTQLNQDASKVAVLLDDSGKEYRPVRWENMAVYGNHGEGVLIFTSVKPYPQHIKLIMNDINGVQKMFTWILIED
jgi:hypothetical protein